MVKNSTQAVVHFILKSFQSCVLADGRRRTDKTLFLLMTMIPYSYFTRHLCRGLCGGVHTKLSIPKVA